MNPKCKNCKTNKYVHSRGSYCHRQKETVRRKFKCTSCEKWFSKTFNIVDYGFLLSCIRKEFGKIDESKDTFLWKKLIVIL